MMPKMPPKTPRSLTWNQVLFTFTTDRAPKLWKYMFRLQSRLMLSSTWVPAVFRNMNPIARLTAAAPRAPMRMALRPPMRSANGPLNATARP